jgi:hypothetical protein
MVPYQPLLVTTAFYVMALVFFSFILVTVLYLYRNNRATKRLALLRPVFIEIMRHKTGEVVTSLKVPNLVGELMDVDVPQNQIEMIRLNVVKTGDYNHLLWLSILVCAAYEDVMSFKDEMLKIMKNDLESLGLHEDARNISTLCKYPISAYIFFRILTCMLDEKISSLLLHSSFKEIREYADSYNIPQNVADIGRFRVIRASLKYFWILIVGVFLSTMLFIMPLPEHMVWLSLLVVLVIIIFTIWMVVHIAKQLVKPISCEDIEADIMADVPDLKIRMK